ncbi:MAG TPA: hypothetical protein VFP93_00965 [Gammaproteobacteria bacterium]|nr:hypothetical protein [Gammaproteobacteria bacterium]
MKKVINLSLIAALTLSLGALFSASSFAAGNNDDNRDNNRNHCKSNAMEMTAAEDECKDKLTCKTGEKINCKEKIGNNKDRWSCKCEKSDNNGDNMNNNTNNRGM